jgi:hypothetical protein
MLLIPYHRTRREFRYDGLLPNHLSRMKMRGVLRMLRHIRHRLADALLGSCRNGLLGCPPRVLFQPLVKGELKSKHQCHIRVHVGPFALGLVTCLI